MGWPSIKSRGSSRCHPRGLYDQRWDRMISLKGDIPDEQDCGLVAQLVLFAFDLKVNLVSRISALSLASLSRTR